MSDETWLYMNMYQLSDMDLWRFSCSISISSYSILMQDKVYPDIYFHADIITIFVNGHVLSQKE